MAVGWVGSEGLETQHGMCEERWLMLKLLRRKRTWQWRVEIRMWLDSAYKREGHVAVCVSVAAFWW